MGDTELEFLITFDKPVSSIQSRVWMTSDVHAAQVARIRHVLHHYQARSELQLAMAYVLHDRRHAAESIVDTITRDRTAALSSGELLIMARLNADLGRTDEAKRLLAQSVVHVPRRPSGFELQFVANTRRLLLPELASTTPEDAPLLAAQAHDLARLFQAKKALTWIDRAIELTPNDRRALVQRANLRLLTNQTSAAIGGHRRLSSCRRAGRREFRGPFAIGRPVAAKRRRSGLRTTANPNADNA